MHSPARSSLYGKPDTSFAVSGKLANPKTMKTASKYPMRKTPADFSEASAVFKAPSNPNRLLMVDTVANGERCVADLTDERRGTRAFYSLKKPCLLTVFCCLDEFHAEDAG